MPPGGGRRGGAGVAAPLAGAAFWLVRTRAPWRAARGRASTQRLHGIGAENGLGLAVDKVEVEGRDRQSQESILAALGVQPRHADAGHRSGAARARLEALPWVRSAEIERRMPDTLFIKIDERQPLRLLAERTAR